MKNWCLSFLTNFFKIISLCQLKDKHKLNFSIYPSLLQVNYKPKYFCDCLTPNYFNAITAGTSKKLPVADRQYWKSLLCHLWRKTKYLQDQLSHVSQTHLTFVYNRRSQGHWRIESNNENLRYFSNLTLSKWIKVNILKVQCRL